MSRNEALNLAIDLAEQGYYPIPAAIIRDDDKSASYGRTVTNKRPACDNGYHDASTDRDRLRQLFDVAQLRQGEVWAVGLYLGKSGLFALDVDIKPDVDGPAAFQGLAEEYGGNLPDHPIVTTASGGQHHYLAKPEGVHIGTSHDLAEYGVDVIRGDDGFVVAPGVVTPWGSWQWDEATKDIPAPVVPAWLLPLLDTGDAAARGDRRTPWRRIDRDTLDPATAEALQRLEQDFGAHEAYLGPAGEVRVCRPGKRSGSSASIGYVGPGVVKVFSSNWPPFKAGERYDLDDLARLAPRDGSTRQGRQLMLTPASQIKLRRVKWVWEERLALGTIGLLAGPEGQGKSAVTTWLAARLSRGEIEGEHFGEPRNVLLCTTEDSWESTIAPRLLAHNADMGRVFRVETQEDGIVVGLNLPRDLAELHQHASDAALLVLDPLMSRIDETLDTHRDADVRRSLEPLASFAETTGAAILGVIHHNKGDSDDPLQKVMGSKAFTAVARSVHTVIADPEDDTLRRRFFGTTKNNLGRMDLPIRSFVFERRSYDTDEGPGTVGHLVWGAEYPNDSIAAILARQARQAAKPSALERAAEWLEGYLEDNGGEVEASAAIRDGEAAGHSERTLRRARTEIGASMRREPGSPPSVLWFIPQDPTLGRTGRTDLDEPRAASKAKHIDVGAARSPSEPPEGWDAHLYCTLCARRGAGTDGVCASCRPKGEG